MTIDELKQANAAGAHIYGIGDDGKLHRIEKPEYTCPSDRYLALLPFDSDLVRDAERYRWLKQEAGRNKADDPLDNLRVSVTYRGKLASGGYNGLLVTPVGDDFDARIDAAIHAQAGESK